MLTLTRQTTTFDDTDHRHSWPLRVTAEADGSMPAEIFVYHAGMPGQPDQDRFECVASVQQLSEIPLGRPATSDVLAIPYYRRAVMEVWCRTAAQAEEAWESLQTELDVLVENWLAAESLAESETYHV